MSYNRATQQPCTNNCCKPVTYTLQAAPWNTQANAAKLYNIVADVGLQSGAIEISFSATSTINHTGAPENDCCVFEGWDAEFSFTEQSGGSTDTCMSGDFEPTCSPTCPDPPCGIGGEDCGVDSNEVQYECFDCSHFSDSEGVCDEASITGNGALMHSQNPTSGTSTIDANWYASGMFIVGTPENFIGYPSELDACSYWRKGLRRIFARGQGTAVQIRWLVVKEWMTGAPANIVYYETIDIPQNQFALASASIDLNEDIGISCYGASTALFRNLRLEGGSTAGDGSFGEGSGWYDITNKTAQFYYTKPNYSRWTTGFQGLWHCGGSCHHCCENGCGCSDAGLTFKSREAQILTSDDVENSLGECIWDASPDGANFGGDYPQYSADGMFHDGFEYCTGSGAGGTCTV